MSIYHLIPFDIKNSPDVKLETQLNVLEDALFVSYKLTGNLSALEIGSEPVHERKIKLWEKTCFELFIKNQTGQYMEFNFSPVFEWNAFFFNQKGDALKEWDKIKQVKIDILHSLDVFQLIAEIKKADFPDGFFHQCEAGLTTVLKEKNGNLSYWALSHEDKRPNFHHFDSFKYRF